MKRLFLCLLCSTLSLAQSSLTPEAIFTKTKAATLIVLAGTGSGRLSSIGTGVFISDDGVLLTAAHVIRGANEVQVRTASGDIYDRLTLLGIDERRDVAALKIAASGTPFLQVGSVASLQGGQSVYSVATTNGLSWSLLNGIFSSVRPADEVSGAGSGYRLLQFTAPTDPGVSGAPLVDSQGRLIAIVTRKVQSTAFAVPIDAVDGLPASGLHVSLAPGSLLQMPAEQQAEVPHSSAAVASLKPDQLLRDARTIWITSKTSFLTVDTLDRALLLQKEWKDLNLAIVTDPRLADLKVEVDRPLFTYVHTFVLTDTKSSIVLGSGKATAFDGTIASGPLSKQIVAILAKARLPQKPIKK